MEGLPNISYYFITYKGREILNSEASRIVYPPYEDASISRLGSKMLEIDTDSDP
jgi:hypothetical protein